MSVASALTVVRGEGCNLYAIEVQGGRVMYARGDSAAYARRALKERECIPYRIMLSTTKTDPKAEVIV